MHQVNTFLYKAFLENATYQKDVGTETILRHIIVIFTHCITSIDFVTKDLLSISRRCL
jgi:hypothetical protein